MLKFSTTLLLLFVFKISFSQKQIDYPLVPKDSTFNTYFDTIICDPYQWMEDPADPRLIDWLKEQEKLSNKVSRKQVHKESLKGQISAMYYGEEKEKTDDYIERKRNTVNKYEFKNKYKNYNRSPDLTFRKKGSFTYKTLVNVKDYQSNNKDHVIITGKRISNKEDLLAVEISHNGSDWREVHFYDLLNGKKLTDTLKLLRAGSNIIWDGRGVYYDRYKEPVSGRELLDKVEGQAIYYHTIGTKQSDDKLLYSNPDFTGKHYMSFSKIDSIHLILYHYLFSGSKSYKALGHVSLNQGESFDVKNFIMLPNRDDIQVTVEEKFGDTVILKTNWNSPKGRVLKSDITKQNDLTEIVPEYDVTLREVNKIGKNKIACIYQYQGKYSIIICTLSGEVLNKLDFPMGKKVKHFYESDSLATHTNFCLTSYYHPKLWYQLSLDDFTFKPAQSVSVPFKPEEIETRYVKYKSKDGTEIPMFITCLKSTKLDKNNPTLIYGYGGYGTVVEPSYNKLKMLFILHGGILAVPNIRGGGIEGAEWSKDGKRLKKQNAIDDFIAAAEYLIAQKYTNPEKLAINGGSHGGLLVAAALTQRPELYKTAIASAGVYDMLRFEKYTIGWAKTNNIEFGTTNNKDDFNNLVSYSPLHNIYKGVEYPNILLTTGDKDDRVPPLHSYKFLATLQANGSKNSLYQIYIAEGAAHNGAFVVNDWMDQELFELYYLLDELDMKFW